jgi:hypothetical protein
MSSRLGLIGGFTKAINGGSLTAKYDGGKTAKVSNAAENKHTFVFATLASDGPLVTRQDLFWQTASATAFRLGGNTGSSVGLTGCGRGEEQCSPISLSHRCSFAFLRGCLT